MLVNEFEGMTPQQVIQNGLVRGLYSQLLDLQTVYQKVDNYINGVHDLRFASEKYSNAFGRLFRAFADNYCPRVVNALSDYLQLEGWECAKPSLQAELDRLWKSQRMETISAAVHTSAFKYGDAYVIAANDSKGVERLYKQNSRQVRVLYDTEEPDKVVLAIKLWQRLDLTWRLNVYTPGVVYRFSARTRNGQTATTLKNFVPVSDDGDAVETTKNDIIPVFHFANEATNEGNGVTELRDIYPIQDALNKAVCDMLVGMEYQAFRQRWATGIEVQTDDNGKPIPPMVSAIDRLVYSANEEAKFGEFSQIDLSQFLEVQENLRTEMARLATIPPNHLLLSGTFPSGEALKASEQPLLNKVGKRETLWGNVWEQIAYYHTGQLEEVIEEGESIEVEIDAKWKDVSPRSEQEIANAELAKVNTAVVKVNLGVPVATALEEIGYTQEEVEAMALIEQIPIEELGKKLVDYFNTIGVPVAVASIGKNPAATGATGPNGEPLDADGQPVNPDAAPGNGGNGPVPPNTQTNGGNAGGAGNPAAGTKAGAAGGKKTPVIPGPRTKPIPTRGRAQVSGVVAVRR